MTQRPDQSLVADVRRGDSDAWEELISQYEGRLLAFVDARLRDRAAAEDVVQETFLGFLVSLPNYDPSTPLESFLFAIASHKLTDLLRRRGRRPELPLLATGEEGAPAPAGKARVASSLARSRERRVAEERVLADCLRTLVQSWISRGEFERLRCIELLFVLGWPNKDVATRLEISEQAVANHKHFVVGKIRDAVARSKLRDVDLSEFNL